MVDVNEICTRLEKDSMKDVVKYIRSILHKGSDEMLSYFQYLCLYALHTKSGNVELAYKILKVLQ
jgi:hypothetical protein